MEKTYDWSAYYQEALKRQKKENRKLASELSDMQAKQEMLAAKYTKFTSGAFGKVLHASTLPKRAIKKLLGRSAGGARVTGETVEATHPLYLAYEEKLASQKYAYREWIREIEVALPQIGKAPEGAVEVLSFAEFASNLLAGDLWENEAKVLMVAEDPAALSDDACGAAWAYFAAHPSARLWYAQEDQIDLSGERTLPWFKPRWSPETLISFFYFGSFAAFRSEALENCRELLTEVCAQCCNDLEQDARSVVYAASLALAFADMDAFAVDTTGQGMCEEVCGLTDRILYHRAATGSGQEDACQPENAADPLKVNAAPQSPEPVVLETTNSMDYASCPQYFGYEARFVPIKQAVLRRLGIQTRALFTSAPDVVSIVPVHDAALVSIIIPSKDHPELVEQCLTQLLEKTTYPALELILVDNGSGNEHRKQIETITASLSARYHVRIHYQVEPMPFNFSKMCNLGADVANGKYLLLLNDDTTVCEQDWLEIMVGEAQYPGVGAVGAKLWYPMEERIQHAGITNLAIGPSHKLVTFPDDRTYYFGHNTMNYVMSAVTAACLLVRADLYRQVGGMDETMAVAYNDVDLNFKLLEHGYRSVQRNDAVLIHHESLSRGMDEQTKEKWDRLLQEKETLYRKHPLFDGCDPYYDPYLTGNRPDYEINYAFPYERSLETEREEEHAADTVRTAPRTQQIMLTVERTGLQNKFHASEPEIFHVEGWCYMLQADNCRYRRKLLLQSVQDGQMHLYPVRDRYRYDVDLILPMQQRVSLSGFVCRILQDTLEKGTYKVGMLYEDLINGKTYQNWSDQLLRNE